MRRHRDEFRFIVTLTSGARFAFAVEDWDTDDTPLFDEQVIEMANDLVRSGVGIYGSLSDLFPNCPTPKVFTRLDPEHVEGVFLVTP